MSSVMGAPRKEIDFDELDKLCAIQSTEEEIAGWFGIDIDTLVTRIKEKCGMTFSEYFAQKKGTGKISLRRKQYQTAMAGNPTLLIWLGKQWLNQKDKHEISGDDKAPLKLSYSLDE